MYKKFIVCLFASAVLVGCKKRVEEEIASTVTSADMATIEGSFNDVQKVSDDALQDEESTKSNQFGIMYGSGVTVTVTPAWPDTTFPKTVRIDFGEGAQGLAGRTRKGVVEIVATGRYRQEGATFTISPMDYYVNDSKVEGQKIVTNKGRNNQGNINYDIQIVDGKVIEANGRTLEWESLRNREWIAGETTTFLSDGWSGITDDVYLITGTGSGVNRNGRNFDVTITQGLRVQLDCKWITSGTFELAPEGVTKRVVDYGDGSCDAKATVTVNGKDYEVVMW